MTTQARSWTLDPEAVTHLASLIERSQHIVLLPHTTPDGDALGSTLALSGILSAHTHRAVSVISPDPIERYLQWMPQLDTLVHYHHEPERALELIGQADLILHLDHNTTKRLRHTPLVEAVYASSAPRVLIDHHLDPEEGFELCFSMPGLSSTSELVYMLIRELGWTSLLTPELSTLLLTGIVTDTRRLMYGCFYPEVFDHFAQLLAHGADYPRIIDSLSYHGALSQLRLQGYALHHCLEIVPELRTAIITLTREDMVRLEVSKGDTEGLPNLPLMVEGIDASVLIREDADQVKLSMRSIGDVPVNLVASRGFGGGGHLNAAGAELRQGDLEMAKNIYLRELKKVLAE